MKTYYNPTVEIMILQHDDIVRTSGEGDSNVFLLIKDARIGKIDQQIDNANDFN